jgi:hypothetical protein
MDELDCDRALAYPGRDSFHRAIANVAHREDARDVRLEQAGVALQRPAPWAFTGLEQIQTRQQEPPLITLDGSIQPSRARLRADEYEQRIRGYAAYVSGAIAPE